jgi:hypothetical protein
MYQNCTKRRNMEQRGPTRLTSTYATVAAGGTDGNEYRVRKQGNPTLILPLEQQMEPSAGAGGKTEEEIVQHSGRQGPILGIAKEMQGPSLEEQKVQRDVQNAPVERMVIEVLSREVDEGVSVDTTGLLIPEESVKMEGGQRADKQQLEGEEGRGQTYWWKRVKGRRVREIYSTGADGQRKRMCVGLSRIGRTRKN